jgi:hypothetical protein
LRKEDSQAAVISTTPYCDTLMILGNHPWSNPWISKIQPSRHQFRSATINVSSPIFRVSTLMGCKAWSSAIENREMISLFRSGTTAGKVVSDFRESRAIQSHNFRSHAVTQASSTTIQTVRRYQGSPSLEAEGQNGTISTARHEIRGIPSQNSPPLWTWRWSGT